MFRLIAGVEFGVIGLLVREHLEHDFQQALSQAAPCAGVAPPLLALLLLIGLAPGAGFAKAVRPEMNRMPEELIARPADLDSMNLAGLEWYRRGPGKAWQHVVVPITRGVGADGGQEARR